MKNRYAQEHGIGYRASWDRFKAGKIPEAYQDECGRILIPIPADREEYVVCYARVSSSENRKNLEAQVRLPLSASLDGRTELYP